MAEKEWSENPEDDPIELQKEQLKLGKEFLDRIKKQEAEERARREEAAANPQPVSGYIRRPKIPSFEEVSAVLKRAWDEVERIMPTAGDQAKAMAFQSLTHAAAPPSPFEE